MPDHACLRLTTLDLRALTLSALRHMYYEREWAFERIGKAIGYTGGQMPAKVMRGDCRLLGTVETINLARLASAHGHEALADEASSAGKRAVPVEEGAAGEGLAIDGDPRPELLAVQRYAGLTNDANGSPDADQHARRLIGAAFALRRDLSA